MKFFQDPADTVIIVPRKRRETLIPCQCGCGIPRIDYGETPPRFWWTSSSGGIFRDRIDRFHIRADSKRGMSENDVADELGMFRIWGDVNYIFEMKV